MNKRKRQGIFVPSLLIFHCVLLLLITAALVYVHNLLVTYERWQPERIAEEALLSLTEQAENGTLSYGGSKPTAGRFEEGTDIQKEYVRLLRSDGVKVSKKAGLHEENEAVYSVKTADGLLLAEITLEAVGEPVTRLAVFSWQEWEVRSAVPVLDPTTYTLTVPGDFSVSINGVPLGAADGVPGENGGITYTAADLYFRPRVEIRSAEGEEADYSIKGNKILPVIFDYSLTLPDTLTLTLNGTAEEGAVTEDGYRLYRIRQLTKPEVIITDLYGNHVDYDGGNTIPLTHLTVRATDRHRVTADGMEIPASAVFCEDNPEYAPFAAYVSDLPRLAEYRIAVLRDNAVISVLCPDGSTVTADGTERELDLTVPTGADTVPDSIAAEVNVLDIAKKWSLFVSNDLTGWDRGLSEIAQFLIPSSYQHEIAEAYAKGVDITFTSAHTLQNPPFTDESIANFVMITENCFSVDVSFKKHMVLYYGEVVVDTMNERLYFVKYDDPANDSDTPAWKLASMKEMGNNAE